MEEVNTDDRREKREVIKDGAREKNIGEKRREFWEACRPGVKDCTLQCGSSSFSFDFINISICFSYLSPRDCPSRKEFHSLGHKNNILRLLVSTAKSEGRDPPIKTEEKEKSKPKQNAVYSMSEREDVVSTNLGGLIGV